MKLITTLLILLTLTSCGELFKPLDFIKDPKNKDPRKHQTTDTEFDSYIGEFEEYYNRSVGHIPINFANLDGRKAGVCYTWSDGYAEIEIDREQWENEHTEYEKIALIFHELGHCELGRHHKDSKREDKCPESLMNWQLTHDSCVSKYYDEYIDELFK